MEVSVWSSGLTSAATTVGGIATGNPVAAITGAISFTAWLVDRWQKANREVSAAKRPSATVPELINSVSGFDKTSGWFQQAAAEQAPTRGSDEAIVRRRAVEIGDSDLAGTNFDNWMRAVIELKIGQRAAEIARSAYAGGDLVNWLRAERELKVAQRAEAIASSSDAGSDYENWLRAEYEIEVAQRARDIAYSRPAGSDKENWLLAERELAADRAVISQRAAEIAGSAETAVETRTRTEIMLRAEEIAKTSGWGSDWENWLRAEREQKAYDARLDEQVRRITASPEAALGHWLRAEQQLRAEGRIAAT